MWDLASAVGITRPSGSRDGVVVERDERLREGEARDGDQRRVVSRSMSSHVPHLSLVAMSSNRAIP
jgi:hypothetical protein